MDGLAEVGGWVVDSWVRPGRERVRRTLSCIRPVSVQPQSGIKFTHEMG